MDNFVIEVLNKEHGKKVKKYFEDNYPSRLKYNFSFSNTRDNLDDNRFYGIVNGTLNCFNKLKVSRFKSKIMTLEELEKEKQEFPKLMYVWDDNKSNKFKRIVLSIIQDKRCIYPIITVAGEFSSIQDFNNKDSFDTLKWRNCEEIEEENPLKKEFDKLQQQIKDLQAKANEIQKKL